MQIASALALPCGVTLPNRIAKSATSEALAHRETGRLDDQLVKLYERWGAGGAGLLITGNVVIDLDGRTEPGNVVLGGDQDHAMLASWARAGQANGAKLIMQLNHAGRQTPRRISREPVGPSAIGLKGKAGLFAVPRALADREIRALIGRFAEGAAVAIEAGFAGVQIHAAHGYLISQFLSPLANHRDDDWGGDAVRRMKFLVETVRATRARIGATKILSVKLNSADFQRGGFTNDDAIDVVRVLEAEGIDLLEISGGSYESSAMMGADSARSKAREGYFLDFAKQIRSVTKLPLMLTGGLRSVTVMNEIVGRDIDIVGMARPLIAEPDLPQRMFAGTAEGAATELRRISIRMADDVLQIAWYQRQLRRMGRGQLPHPALGRWSSVLVGFFRNYAFNPLSPRKRRVQLPAPVA